ncbi:hypothetical protein KDL30_15865 [bacterium]|nr:hypothetical protein [bacterium]
MAVENLGEDATNLLAQVRAGVENAPARVSIRLAEGVDPVTVEVLELNWTTTLVSGPIGSALVEIDPERISSLSVGALETALSRGLAEAFRQAGNDVDLPWVARLAIVVREEEILEDWLRHRSRVRIRALASGAQLYAGWGNSAFVTQNSSSGDLRRLEAGFVDGQLLWSSLSHLSEDSTRLILELTNTNTASAEHRARVSFLSSSLVIHRLSYDEFVLDVQGDRRETAAGLLDSWGYNTAANRLERRISDIDRVLRQRSEEADKRYKSVVERVLEILGLLTVLDVVIGLLGLAYSGSVETIPGEANPTGLLDTVRALPADGILIFGFVVVILLYGMFRLRKE